ncbi:MAG TPA: pitrilysin family protein [Lacipirellulaceae bacterium]|jgi:zinc protease|nr:pitrilysin family protein [Lacipirellulaceae bacterium]
MLKSVSIACHVLALVALVASSESHAASTSTPKEFTHVRTVGDISEYRLDDNGLTVLLLPDHSAPAVTMMVTYRVGSRNESYGTTGSTHLLEHLMFKGTRDHNKEAGTGFDQLLERTGAITNATTSQDRTNYYETVGSQDLPLAVSLEADRMRNLRLREEDRRPEMTVVRNEYEIGENNPAEALEKEVWAVAYIAHPYHHSTIGWHSDFEKVPIEKLRNFYDTFYWPNNATVTIIGDFDTGAALELVKEKYGAIPKSPHPIPHVYTVEPPQTGERRVIVQRPGELGVVTIAQKIPAATSADYAPLRVLGMILSDGRNSRMYQALTDKNLTTDVSADPQFNHDPSLFFLSAELAPGAKHEDVEKRMLDEIARVQKDGVTSKELAAAIAKYTADTAYQRDGSMAMAFALNECIAVGDWSLYYHVADNVKKVTAADVQRVAKQYFDKDERTTGWYIPREEKAEDAAARAKAAAEAARPDSDPSTDQKADGKSQATAKAAPPKPHPPKAPSKSDLSSIAAPKVAKIAPRIVRSKTDNIDLLICPSGVKDVVAIKGSFPAFDSDNPILGELAAEMLERGTKQHDAEAIAALLDKVGARIQFGNEAGSITFEVRCLKKDSAQIIKLLAEQLMEPTFPKDEFEKLQKQKIAEAQQLRVDTTQQALIAFRRAVYPAGSPQYRLSADERIAALHKATADDVKAYHDKFFGPDCCTMVVVGDIDPPTIQKQVASAFEDWKGGKPLPNVAMAKPVEKAETLTVEIPGKESVSVFFGVPSGLQYADKDSLPLSLATNVLGNGFTSRLLSTVRDTEGLTYGIGAQLAGAGKLEQSWIVYASFNPMLLKQGLESTRRELAKWHRDGITKDELDYRKSALVGAHRVALATSSGLANSILATVRRGLDLNWIDDYPTKVEALTLDQVNDVIRHRIDPDKLVVTKAGTMKAD